MVVPIVMMSMLVLVFVSAFVFGSHFAFPFIFFLFPMIAMFGRRHGRRRQ
jgi:hypothetical protein